MADLKFKPSSGEAVEVQKEEVKGQHATARVAIIGGSVVLSLLAIAVIVAIYKDPKPERDYVAAILPVISGAVLGCFGYVAGRKSQKE